MQIGRIQRLISSNNINDIYFGYILISDDEKFAKILLQKRNDLIRLYILYNNYLTWYTMRSGLLESESTNNLLFIEIATHMLEDTNIYIHSPNHFIIINGKK